MFNNQKIENKFFSQKQEIRYFLIIYFNYFHLFFKSHLKNNDIKIKNN